MYSYSKPCESFDSCSVCWPTNFPLLVLKNLFVCEVTSQSFSSISSEQETTFHSALFTLINHHEKQREQLEKTFPQETTGCTQNDLLDKRLIEKKYLLPEALPTFHFFFFLYCFNI
jgi:hypothetical protein